MFGYVILRIFNSSVTKEGVDFMLYNHWLDAFLAVAESGSFSKAAARLFLSQPALTQQINALETSMGVELFSRSRRGAELTTAGQILLKKSKRIIDLCRRTEEECRSAAPVNENTIRVAVSQDDQMNVYTPINQEFCRRYPSVTIQLVTMGHEQNVPALLDDMIDIIICSQLPAPELSDRISFALLKEVLHCVLVPRNHPLAERPYLLLSDLREETLFVPRAGAFQDADEISHYIRTHEPQIHLKEVNHDISTRYQCELENALMLTAQFFSSTSTPLISIPLHCSMKAFFGLSYRQNATACVHDYVKTAQELFQKMDLP